MPSTADPLLAAATPADLALVRAVRAWGGADAEATAEAIPALWARFSPAYRARLVAAWAGTTRMTPELAWQTLLRDHVAAAQHDPERVHPSWRERILRAESPAVRRLVSRQGVGTSPGRAVQPGANPEAVAWALALWAERLVGDVAEAPDDPPIILALASFSTRDLARLARVAGLVKRAFAAADGPGMAIAEDATARFTAADRVHVAFFRRLIGAADPRLVPLARGDIASAHAPPRRHHAAVGLITLARLLKDCNPHRGRWALQHVPYPVARLVNTLGEGDHVRRSSLPARAIRAWEDWVLEAAWSRLLAEGRLDHAGGRKPA